MHKTHFAKSRLAAIASAILALHMPLGAVPTTIGAPLMVSATVLSTCIVSPMPITFADYMGTFWMGVSSGITVSCSPDVAGYQIALDSGTGAGASVSGSRRMTSLTNPSATLAYNLYRDPTLTQPWGFTRDVDTMPSTGLMMQTYAIYAKVPAHQSSEVGVYSDTVTVSLLY